MRRIFLYVLLCCLSVQASAQASTDDDFWTIYIKASSQSPEKDLKAAYAKIELQRSRTLDGNACHFTSYIANKYPRQHPTHVGMVIVGFNGNCPEFNREITRSWFRDPTFIVIQAIAYPSMSGSN